MINRILGDDREPAPYRGRSPRVHRTLYSARNRPVQPSRYRYRPFCSSSSPRRLVSATRTAVTSQDHRVSADSWDRRQGMIFL